jgi:hypothetical protein
MLAAFGFLTWTASALQAAVIPFDPDGGGASGTVQLGSLDFVQGNSLGEDVLLGGVGHEWNLYYQSNLGSLLDGNANVITGTGLNADFQITVVAGITVRTTFLDGTNLRFELAPNPTTSFIRLYYDTNLNANPLAGTGFMDGTLILDATVNGDLQGFFNFTATGVANLDSFNANDWPGTLTRTGIGAFSTSAEVTYANTDFFNGTADELPALVFANSSQILPYRETDPSRQFWDGSGFVTTEVGAVNGVSGPDVLAQADANGSFEPVPEPTSLALWAMGTGMVAAVQWKRKRSNV